MALHEDLVGARYNYGLALYEIGEYEPAVEELLFVTEQLPDHLRAQLYLGRSLSALDRDSLAFAVFDTLLSKDSTYYEAWIDRGDIDLKRDQYEQAVAQYVLVTGLSPERWEAYHRQGLAHYVQGRYAPRLLSSPKTPYMSRPVICAVGSVPAGA